MALYTKDDFLKLLARFRKGQSTPDEQAAMETWYDSLDDPEIDTSRSPESKDLLWQKIMEQTHGEQPQSAPSYAGNRFRYLYYAAAAVLLIVGGLFGYLAMNGKTSAYQVASTLDEASVIFANETDQPREFILPDGSKVVLEPAAKLRCARDFNEVTRTVQLEGNAFFSVVKSKHVPFIVQSDDIATKVLGTEFTIKKNSSTGETEVEVLTGRVEVNVIKKDSRKRDPEKQQVLLTANLKATFQPEKNELVMGLSTEPRLVQKKEAVDNSFIFNDRPLREVIRSLEKAYGIPIQVANQQILDCPVTANLANESLTTQLDIVMTALNADFTVTNGGIFIKNGGCGPAVD